MRRKLVAFVAGFVGMVLVLLLAPVIIRAVQVLLWYAAAWP